MNRKSFLEAYRAELKLAYDWPVKHPDRMERFMAAVEETISGEKNNWNADGPAVNAAWRFIGGRGKPSLKALRALPEGV